MTKKEHIVVGLDIGTTKICAVVGEIQDDRSIHVIGVGSHRSHGLRKGMVVNIDVGGPNQFGVYGDCGKPYRE